MIDRTKIGRELVRIGHQITDAVKWPIEAARQWRHDRAFPGNLTITGGAGAPGSRIALYFIYQPGGLAASTLLTCRALADRGYGVLVVSNAGLSASDRARLSETGFALIERPNYGYDFGGYRDGLRFLRAAGHAPDTLLMLNDSIWFPLHGGTLLDRMEQDPAPFQSPVFEKKVARRVRNAHYQSYLFLMRRPLLEHPAFWAYWDGHHLSDDKRVVLWRGEKGFSQAMFKAGFGAGEGGTAPSTRRMLHQALSRQDTAFLRKTLTYAAYEHADLVAEARALLRMGDDTPAWRARALAHLDRAVEVGQPMGSFCYACSHLFGFDFLKKSSYPLVHDGMRHQYLRAVQAGDLPTPPPEMLAEIRASRMNGAMTTDPAFDPGQAGQPR